MYRAGLARRSSAQQTARMAMQSISQPWRDLDQDDRDDWAAFAADPAQEQTNPLGQAYYLSGWQWFAKINQRLLAAGEALRTTYPPDAYPVAPTMDTPTFAEVSGNPKLELLYPWLEFDGYWLIAFASFLPLSAQETIQRKRRLLAATDSPGNDAEDLTAALLAAFATPAAGARVTLTTYRQTAQGMRSDPVVQSATYTV